MSARALSLRARALLEGPIAPTLLRTALPNVLVMVAQAGAGLGWWATAAGREWAMALANNV